MPEQVNIRFYRELNDFLPDTLRHSEFTSELKKPRSVKDLIESIGVPHTEVDLIIVNGESVEFDYQVRDEDIINVYPLLRKQASTSSGRLSSNLPLLKMPAFHNQPVLLNGIRFILDVHLGRLTAYLRMLGFDARYQNNYDDLTLATISNNEQRILLTCDRRLLMRKQINFGYFVRNRQPRLQLTEVLSRFDLYHKQKPFSRCISCNGMTRAVSKEQVAEHLLPKTKKYYDEFFQCECCAKIYWKGSHYQKMLNMIESIRV